MTLDEAIKAIESALSSKSDSDRHRASGALKTLKDILCDPSQ